MNFNVLTWHVINLFARLFLNWSLGDLVVGIAGSFFSAHSSTNPTNIHHIDFTTDFLIPLAFRSDGILHTTFPLSDKRRMNTFRLLQKLFASTNSHRITGLYKVSPCFSCVHIHTRENVCWQRFWFYCFTILRVHPENLSIYLRFPWFGIRPFHRCFISMKANHVSCTPLWIHCNFITI